MIKSYFKIYLKMENWKLKILIKLNSIILNTLFGLQYNVNFFNSTVN